MRNRSANTLRGGSLQRSNWGGFRLVLQAGDKVIDAIDYTDILCPIYVCQRPYCAEHTRSHQNSEVKQRKARSVLGWGTAWEVLRMLLALVSGLIPNASVLFCAGTHTVLRFLEAKRRVDTN